MASVCTGFSRCASEQHVVLSGEQGLDHVENTIAVSHPHAQPAQFRKSESGHADHFAFRLDERVPSFRLRGNMWQAVADAASYATPRSVR